MVSSSLSALNVNGYEFPRKRSMCPPMSSPYRTKDGQWVSITINDYERYWTPLCRAVDCEDLIDDPRFNSKIAIHDPDNKKECVARLEAGFVKFDAADIVKRLRDADIVVTQLADFKDNHSNPQALANGYMAPITYPTGHETTLGQPPIRFEGMNEPVAVQAKPVGADTAAVFASLGIE